MRKKNNRFVFSLKRKRLPIRTPPMDHVSGLKKMLLYKIQQMGVGTLTRLPPMNLRLISGSVAPLSLTADFFGAMGTRKRGFSLALRSGASGG
jgi:hypothetical protein